MLQQVIIFAWNEANGERNKSKIPALFVKNQSRTFENQAPHKLQFLGLDFLFTAQSSDTVIAFKLHIIVVYYYDEESSFANI